MNIENYYNFIKIVDAGTISAASRELLIAQPALSNQLKSLEEEYGVQLLTRGARHIHLTDAGKILYENAKQLCVMEETMHKEIDAHISGKTGTLRLGISPSFPEPTIMIPIERFCDAHPEIDFEFYEEHSLHIMDRVKNGDVEIGIVHTESVIPATLQVLLAMSENYMAAFRKDNRWIPSNQEMVPLSALKNIPLSTTRGVYKKVTDCCLRTGFMPKFHSISTNRTLSLMWAKSGKTIAIFPTIAPKVHIYDDLYCRPLIGKGLDSNRTFISLKSRELSPAATAFISYCKEYYTMEGYLK